jgi:threonine synthase
MSYVKGLRCRECGGETPIAPLHVCEICFGPLEVAYDYDGIKRVLTRELIESRPRNLWRYRELLPVDGEPKIGLWSGFTPLVRAERLGAVLGVKELWVKDDSVNHPTFSYKDRVVSVAISKAIEFGFDTVSCASTATSRTRCPRTPRAPGSTATSSSPTTSSRARSSARPSTARAPSRFAATTTT